MTDTDTNPVIRVLLAPGATADLEALRDALYAALADFEDMDVEVEVFPEGVVLEPLRVPPCSEAYSVCADLLDDATCLLVPSLDDADGGLRNFLWLCAGSLLPIVYHPDIRGEDIVSGRYPPSYNLEGLVHARDATGFWPPLHPTSYTTLLCALHLLACVDPDDVEEEADLLGVADSPEWSTSPGVWAQTSPFRLLN